MIDYSVVGILYTRTCPLACRHCIISSSPKATEKMTQQMAAELIDQIPDYCDVVCFTGGEPLLYYNEILPLIRQARALGLRTSLVTGAGWVSANKPEIAQARMRGLKEAGLQTICVSWDVYHEEYSRPENAQLLIEEAKALGIPVSVRGVVSADGAKPEIEDSLIRIQVNYEKIPVIRLGEAESLPEDHFAFSPQVSRGGCSTVLTPVIEPDGSVYACCGPSRGSNRSSPLVLGNVFQESLGNILARAQQDPILEAIERIGPYGLFQLLKNEPGLADILPQRSAYTGICELCLDLCNVPQVVQRLRERLSEHDAQALVTAARLLQTHSTQAQEHFV
jgi:MoaA/NifB/PqqE/SkfB family radical SAM enzyme